jgi:ankyrin repeat protein
VWLLLNSKHGPDVRVRDALGNTPLHLAAANGHRDVAWKLLKLNVEINSQAENGSSPLLLASRNGHVDVLKLLLHRDYNADVHVRDRDGNTPLHHAALHCRVKVVRRLLKCDAKPEVNAQNVEGSTPLHLAGEARRLGRQGGKDVVHLLLDHGADVQARNIRGQTPQDRAWALPGVASDDSRKLFDCSPCTPQNETTRPSIVP